MLKACYKNIHFGTHETPKNWKVCSYLRCLIFFHFFKKCVFFKGNQSDFPRRSSWVPGPAFVPRPSATLSTTLEPRQEKGAREGEADPRKELSGKASSRRRVLSPPSLPCALHFCPSGYHSPNSECNLCVAEQVTRYKNLWVKIKSFF